MVLEGAGSPAEINLRAGDIANMGFAETVDMPVVLAGCIDRGGVIAQIVGTHAVLPVADRDRIKAFLVNKFRGDPSLFDDGYAEIAARTGSGVKATESRLTRARIAFARVFELLAKRRGGDDDGGLP